jgi:hypothetical protein
MLIGYIGAMIYVITEPWHDKIGDMLIEGFVDVKRTYHRGRFVLEAKVDTIILTEGYVKSHG